jgi:hypothetical protein
VVDRDLQPLLLLVSRVHVAVGVSHLPVLPLHALPRLLLSRYRSLVGSAAGVVECYG